MEEELKKTKTRLEKVFIKLSTYLEQDMQTIGIKGLGHILSNLRTTMDLLRIVEKLINQR
jgi:hypothetical protein